MYYKVKLKNAEEDVLVDADVYAHLHDDPYLRKIGLLDNLRKHSTGCAVFQKLWKKARGQYKTETIYLHRYIAEHFLPPPESSEGVMVVWMENGDKLDCRLENLSWVSRSMASRRRKTTSRTGYKGVYQERQRFRAVISDGTRNVHLGMFDTAEEAAMAYNTKSRELFGNAGKLNVLRT